MITTRASHLRAFKITGNGTLAIGLEWKQLKRWCLRSPLKLWSNGNAGNGDASINKAEAPAGSSCTVCTAVQHDEQPQSNEAKSE
jgi:hypothetical protein